MANLVDPAEIEQIVGIRRHRVSHLGRARSSDQQVFVLHSLACLNSGIDLLACRYSQALDLGIVAPNTRGMWIGWQDQPVVLQVRRNRLVPLQVDLSRSPYFAKYLLPHPQEV